MKIGDKVAFWCWLGMDEGDVLQGTLLAIDGDVATVMTGGKKVKVFTNYIYYTIEHDKNRNNQGSEREEVQEERKNNEDCALLH